MRIEFTVPAVPVAQPRPRATAINGQARMYEAAQTHPVHAFKASVRAAAAAAHTGPPLRGPLRIDAVFVFPRVGKYIWKKRPMPRIRHTTKPDRDNCDKALLDALASSILSDDKIACDGRIEKWIAAGDELPHVEVVIEELF